MRRSFTVVALFVGIGAVVLSPCAAQAQSSYGVAVNPGRSTDVPGFASAQEGPLAFGTAIQTTVIHASQWVPYTGTGPLSNLYGYAVPVETGNSYYWTQLNLPVGATVSVIDAFVYDNDIGDWEFGFKATEAARFGSSAYITLGTADSSGTPGFTNLTIYTGDMVFHTFADISGDGTENPVAYVLTLSCVVHSITELRFWGAEVHWFRTISPAPDTATFVDVPLGAFGFQHIEALAASGITAGCNATHFCPDAPITRAQMAVFLAKALGLHWSM